VGDGLGLQIDNIGSLSFQTPTSTLHLSQVLHCPAAIAKLYPSISFVKIITAFFFILADSHYFIKDKQTGLTLLEGKSDGGLYPISSTVVQQFLVSILFLF